MRWIACLGLIGFLAPGLVSATDRPDWPEWPHWPDDKAVRLSCDFNRDGKETANAANEEKPKKISCAVQMQICIEHVPGGNSLARCKDLLKIDCRGGTQFNGEANQVKKDEWLFILAEAGEHPPYVAMPLKFPHSEAFQAWLNVKGESVDGWCKGLLDY